MDTTTAYAEIVKAERNAEGDLVVVGKATGPDLDLDQQICDPEWLKSAMPAWMSSGGNIREQHSSIAAGVATELEQRGDAWMVTATVVDPVSARKVEKGVLKGFSIGIRSPRVVKDVSAPGGRIVGGSIVETSLVDRPANPTCTLVLAKMAKPGPQPPAEVSKGLVRVEELHDPAADQLAELQKAINGFDLIPGQRLGDHVGQVADITQAKALIGGVISSLAASLADGSPTADVGIDTLLGAAKALGWFIHETEEAAMAHVEPSGTPDATKAATPEASAAPVVEPVAPVAPVEKAAEGEPATPETPDLTELVKAAVAEAIAPLQERLAKAEAAPQAGGPVLTRTVQDIQKASNREAMLAEAERLQATADDLTGPSRASYLAKATELRRQATTS
jgi:hypothetical protein